MDTHAQAELLANRSYMIMTALDETTDDQPIYFARALEMDGCLGQGETREAAIEDLRLAMVDFIESLIKDGLPIPEPTPLLKPTLGTATQGAFTFTKQGKGFQPKQDEAKRDVYFLSVRAG